MRWNKESDMKPPADIVGDDVVRDTPEHKLMTVAIQIRPLQEDSNAILHIRGRCGGRAKCSRCVGPERPNRLRVALIGCNIGERIPPASLCLLSWVSDARNNVPGSRVTDLIDKNQVATA